MKIEASGYVGLLLAVFGWRDAIDIPGLKKVLDELLTSLSPRERKVLDLRFGLTSGITLTCKDVAKELNTAPGWVRRWEMSALRKLRHPSRSMRLKPFLDAIAGVQRERDLE